MSGHAKVGRFSLLLTGVMATVMMSAVPALAQPPTNDTVDGAVEIDAIPFTFSQSTLEAAQTDDFETSLNTFCGAPVVEHGVWFTGTSDISGFINVDVTSSDYSAGIMAFEGTPTPEGLLSCGPGSIGPLPAGPDLKLLVFGDGLTAATSGNLVVEITEAPPPLVTDVAIDPVGTVVAKTGLVTISGTVTCSAPTFALQDIFVEQRAGRVILSSFAFADVLCDGATPWSATLTAQDGIFKAGKVEVDITAFSFDDFSFANAAATVRLRGSSGKTGPTNGTNDALRTEARSGYAVR